MDYETKPASDHPMPDLVKQLNLGFEDYLIPIHLDLPYFLTMLRKDGTDLTVSRVLIADGVPAGIALIARRGWTSRLAAMGISPEWRGKGAGTWFMNELLREARERGEREMVLEVIEQNEPAVALYTRSGFEIVRRLVGLIRRDAQEPNAANQLEELDLREMARLVWTYGLPDLPWQISAESIAQMNPPACAYRDGPAVVAISNPEAEHVAVWSLLVMPEARGRHLGTRMLRNIIAQFPGKTWHVPAVCPEGFARTFEQAGFEKESLTQWQMRMVL